jgi:uncharacterized membrane protein YkvA (DUF1232 family)
VAHALSPIDLFPDFIPVLGYLDDVIILLLEILFVIKLMPPHVLEACQLEANEWEKNYGKRPVNKVAVALIVLIWLAISSGVWWFYIR